MSANINLGKLGPRKIGSLTQKLKEEETNSLKRESEHNCGYFFHK